MKERINAYPTSLRLSHSEREALKEVTRRMRESLSRRVSNTAAVRYLVRTGLQITGEPGEEGELIERLFRNLAEEGASKVISEGKVARLLLQIGLEELFRERESL